MATEEPGIEDTEDCDIILAHQPSLVLLKLLAHAIAEPLPIVISVQHFSVHGRGRACSRG